jgi:hypothetical protein
MLSSKLQAALSRNREQLAVLQQQLQRLEAALWKANGLVSKWSKPMGLSVVVRFLKSDLDKEDIRDVRTAASEGGIGRRQPGRRAKCISVQPRRAGPCIATQTMCWSKRGVACKARCEVAEGSCAVTACDRQCL